MSKKVTKDVGIKEHQVHKYSMADPADVDALLAQLSGFPQDQSDDWAGDGVRRVQAEQCLEILTRAEIEETGLSVPDRDFLRSRGFDESCAEWIAAHWIAEYNALKLARERLDNGDTSKANLGRMLIAAEQMGKHMADLWWRAGVDHVSGERREALALTGRPVKTGQKTGAAMTNAKHAALREARFERMRQLAPTLGLEKAARQCEAEGLGSWSSIIKQWGRHKQNLDT